MDRLSLFAFGQRVLRRISFATIDVNCLNCLEYTARVCNTCSNFAEDIYVRGGTLLDLDKMAECQNFPHAAVERFASKEHCVVAVADGRIVGYQWFCDKPARIEERYSFNVQIPADALYGYDAFVRPECRRLKVWSRFHSEYLPKLLARLQRNKIIVMVDQGNSASMNAHIRLGYKLYRKVYVLKIRNRSLFVTREIHTRGRSRRGAQWGEGRQHAEQAGSALS